MYEVEQKIVNMTFDEFKVWECPKRWRLIHMSGEERITPPSYIPGKGEHRYFAIRIVLEKELK